MNDYCAANCCDILWINDILNLKKDSQKKFTAKFKKNGSEVSLSVLYVTIFGTIVEIKQIANKGYLYYVDDGTGVIACKFSEDQFEGIIGTIENEHCEILNQTFPTKQISEQSTMSNISLGDDDSIFNDNSMQRDDIDNHKIQLLGLKSIWDEVYNSYTNLTARYNLGDTVVVEGKLYSYFNMNQIYVNIIRPMELGEEICRISTKLEDGFEPMKNESEKDKRMSGLLTFDHIDHSNSRFPSYKNIETPKQKIPQETLVVTPYLESTVTFDTLPNVSAAITTAGIY